MCITKVFTIVTDFIHYITHHFTYILCIKPDDNEYQSLDNYYTEEYSFCNS
jgi:hypothetical protein